ncbi:MAG TPA: M1 family aminopeptidase [Bacteroidia bacterium]
MKKLFFALSVSTVSISLQAQHKLTCSEAKIRNGIHTTSSMLASPYLVNLENKYDLKFYNLNLNLTTNDKTVSGNVRTLATVKSATIDSFAFELYNTYTIDSVLLNGVKTAVSRHGDEVRVPFSIPLAQGASIDVTTYYHGTAPTISGSMYGDGYNNSTSSQYGTVSSYNLSESYHAYEWFPCKQQLQDKIDSSWVFVTTDSVNKVGSNGVLKNVVTIGNQKRYEWKNIHPIDYYLISVALAQYRDYSIYAHPAGYPDSILIQHYIYNNPQYLIDFKNPLDSTKQLVELFSKLYGIYPWADQKYGHCITGLGGGMEHQTMTTMQEWLSFDIVAHELGHQWFGDKVTCRTWHDIVMNEGFATYTEYLAFENLEHPLAAPYMLNAHNNIMSMPNGSAYNPDTTSENRIFDGRLSYDKGSAVLHTLRFVINNDSMFFLSLRNYLQQFNNATASINDFKNSVEGTTSLNLNQFFTQWYYGEGYPTFNVHWNQTGNNFIMRSIQTVSDYSVTPLFITPILYTLQRSIGDTTIRVMHNADTVWYNFTVAGTVTNIIVDSANWIINKVVGPTHDGTLAGINQVTGNNEQVSVYPNPANTHLTLTLSKGEGTSTLLITDMLGNTVKQVSFNSNQVSINVADLAGGMYILIIKDGTSRAFTQQLIISR